LGTPVCQSPFPRHSRERLLLRTYESRLLYFSRRRPSSFKTTNFNDAGTAVLQATKIEKLNLLSLMPQMILMGHLHSRDEFLHLTNLPDSPLSFHSVLVWAWGFHSLYALFEQNQGVQREAAIGRHLLSLARKTWAGKTWASNVPKEFPDMPIIFGVEDLGSRASWIVGP
jgi:hypothetical protein